MKAEFAAVREEMRTGIAVVREEKRTDCTRIRDEITFGDDETRHQMRILPEEFCTKTWFRELPCCRKA
jgi:hypothetical protein